MHRAIAVFLGLAAAGVVSARPYLEVYYESWQYLIEATRPDVARYRKLADTYTRYAAKAQQRRGQREKVRKYKTVAKLLTEMADRIEVIATSMEDEINGPLNAEKAVGEFPEIEAKLEEVLGKVPARAWLTPAEARALQAQDYWPRPGVRKGTRLALLREHWLPWKEWAEKYPAQAKQVMAQKQRQTMEKAAAARTKKGRTRAKRHSR